MKYFYSGAPKAFTAQTDPELSLGGFISSSPIPNDLLHNIFSEASYLSIQQKKRETKLIVLQNDSKIETATLLSLNFIINDGADRSDSNPNDDSMSVYKVAFVSPDDDNDCFEKIVNSSALPFNATFQDVVSGSTVTLPDMEPQAYLGIWITRMYDFTSNDLKVKTIDYYKAQLDNPTTPGTEDDLDLVLDFTLV